MSDERRGIPPGWTSYMEAGEDGVQEVLRRDPLYASREFAWDEHDRGRDMAEKDAARDGATAVLLAVGAVINDLYRGRDDVDDEMMIGMTAGIQSFMHLAAILQGRAQPGDAVEQEMIDRFAKNLEQIRGGR